ncbi:MAG: MFS transporter [Mesorhizobium sp.]|nr:MAG: MFS transporter [Mesorhizobium sp.]
MPDGQTPTAPKRGAIPIMAIACGVMVGNIYLCQPLLGEIAIDLGVPQRMAAWVAVATQVGYALGIMLLVPLADVADPKRLLRILFALTSAGLIVAACAPELHILIAASLFLSLTTVVPQMLIPLATSLATPTSRGRVVGSLMTGLVMGILLSRTVSGIVAQYADTWRASYALAALCTAALFLFVPNFLPDRPVAHKISYFRLLASLLPLFRHRPLLLSLGMNFLIFGAFFAFWATLAFHLGSPAFGLGPAAAGLFGLWGAPGTLLAPVAGRLSDRWGSSVVNAAAFASLLSSFLIAGTLGSVSLIAIVVAVNLLDFGVQSGQVANQTRIFAIGAEIRGRLNTIYMTVTFSGGAVGALAGSYIWSVGGWSGICTLCSVLVVLAATLLAVSSLLGRAANAQA